VPNAIYVIAPYRHHGTWVFDDPDRGLTREPFVSGVPAMIDRLVRDIRNAEKGFRLLFSPDPFPGYQQVYHRTRGDMGGTWYRSGDTPPAEGWLCPALFKYLDPAPERLYARAEPL
jgi:hypothetical protein